MILCLLYTLQYRSVRGSLCQLHYLRLKSHGFHSRHARSSSCISSIPRFVDSSQLAKYPWTNISSHNTIALARIYFSLLRPHVKINRTNELEERIIVRLWFSLLKPLVPPDEQTHEDLDLLQCEVETDAHPLASGETVSECQR